MELFQTSGIEGYLGDESGLTGTAAAIAFPEHTEELQNVLRSADSRDERVTFQGARTGICGGAVPQGGLVINISRMNKALDFSCDSAGTGSLTVQAGYTLEQLQAALDKKHLDTALLSEAALESWNRYRQSAAKLWFMPNPSEKTATLGGIVSTAAGGGHTGINLAAAIRDIVLVVSDGQRILLRHGDTHIAGFPVSGAIEQVCGAEGLLGAVAEITLALSAKPPEQYGLLGYFSEYSQIPCFMETLTTALTAIPGVQILTADFFDNASATFAAAAGKTLAELGRYPPFPPNAAAALWLELGGSEDTLFTALEAALAALEQAGAMADQTLAATEGRDFERLGRLRHLLTEAANLADSGQPPVLADIRVPHGNWTGIMQSITAALAGAGLSYTLMGHLLWDTISLRLFGDRQTSERLLAGLIEQAAQWRCSSAGDHGIGRIKKNQLQALDTRKAARITELKQRLDPAGRLNPGVMVDI